MNKIKVLTGDVSMPNLGLTDQDLRYLLENVDIVFHSAATVKFNEKLKDAVMLNTLATKHLLEICSQMKKLKSFVHISTAFSNADRKTIEEKVYTPNYNADTIIYLIQNLPEEFIESISEILLGEHPNTYTFTKVLAEQIVLNYSNLVPVAIVRPSIITAAWKEPYPGWVDNISGITGILMECGRGTIKSIICDDSCNMELIPVDIVVNLVITAAWYVGISRPNSVKVYNCTSSQMNPITWKHFGIITTRNMTVYPTKYLTWYPGFSFTKYRNLHKVSSFFHHTIPSTLLDLYLYLSGQKPIMLKLTRKFNRALYEGSFFSTNQWDFKSSSTSELVKIVKESDKSKCFELDFSIENRFDWNDYILEFFKGIREFVLKDDMSSLSGARIKLNRLYWLQKLVYVFLLFIVFRLVLLLNDCIFKTSVNMD
ncbi:putative fatty acyl-CoA reductase CG5065 isoform X1 [Rhynchophorus ferrugineus]